MSTQQESPVSKVQSTSLLSTPWPFWIGLLSQVSKNDDEKTLLFSNFGLPEKNFCKFEASSSPRICNIFDITKTIYLVSERSEQFFAGSFSDLTPIRTTNWD